MIGWVLLVLLLAGVYYYGVRVGYRHGRRAGWESGRDDTLRQVSAW